MPGPSDLEVRPLSEPEDFGPEIAAQENELRAKMSHCVSALRWPALYPARTNQAASANHRLRWTSPTKLHVPFPSASETLTRSTRPCSSPDSPLWRDFPSTMAEVCALSENLATNG